MTFKTIEAEIKPILERDEASRADDMRLYIKYVNKMGVDVGKTLTSREYRIKNGVASYDSIGRIRRKIQEHYANLRPTEDFIRKRKEAESNYRKYAKGVK